MRSKKKSTPSYLIHKILGWLWQRRRGKRWECRHKTWLIRISVSVWGLLFYANRSLLCVVLVTPSPKRIEKLPSNFCDAKKSGVSVEKVDRFCTWRTKPFGSRGSVSVVTELLSLRSASRRQKWRWRRMNHCVDGFLYFKVNPRNSLYCNNGKSKIIPVTCLLQAQRVSVGWGFQITRQLAHECGKFVSPTHRIMSKKCSSDTIGYRTRDLSTCSALPRQTAPNAIINGCETVFSFILIR